MNNKNHGQVAADNLDALHDWMAEQGQTDETMLAVGIEAQVHATLHLAEQQRTANLISFVALLATDGVTPDSSITPSMLEKLGSDMTEGLGIR